MKILITGATGLIGRALCTQLLSRGHQLAILSRTPQQVQGVQCFTWDVEQQTIDASCIHGVDIIVHLAGKGIADGAWTPKNQQAIMDSRVNSMKLIANLLQHQQHQVKKIISASGVGFYGGDNAVKVLDEKSPAGTDFLGECCVAWEKSVIEISDKQDINYAILRTGVVLSTEGGALPLMAKPVQMYVGAALGSGNQIVPWIHIQDVVKAYITAIETELQGVFNLNAPHVVSNKALTQEIAKVLKKPFWPFPVPAFMLKLILGKKSILVLGSTHSSVEKLQNVGFQFQFPRIQEALHHLYTTQNEAK